MDAPAPFQRRVINSSPDPCGSMPTLSEMHVQLATSSLRLRRMVVSARLRLTTFLDTVSGRTDPMLRIAFTDAIVMTHYVAKNTGEARRRRCPCLQCHAMQQPLASAGRKPRRCRRPPACPASLVQLHELCPRMRRSKTVTHFQPSVITSSDFAMCSWLFKGSSSSRHAPRTTAATQRTGSGKKSDDAN